MGHTHHHGHDHGNEEADMWTNMSSLAEFGTSFVANFLWVAGSSDVAMGLAADFLGFSYVAIGIGLGVALLNASGSLYSHRILNTRNQTSASSRIREVDDEGKDITSPAEDRVASDVAPSDHGHHHPPLGLVQRLALAGDYLSHTGDRAGFVTTVVEAAAGTLPRWQRGLVYGLGTLFGGLASVADWRTCKNSMHDHNASRARLGERRGLLPR